MKRRGRKFQKRREKEAEQQEEQEEKFGGGGFGVGCPDGDPPSPRLFSKPVSDAIKRRNKQSQTLADQRRRRDNAKPFVTTISI